LGLRPLGAILHSSNEPGELSQWLCHDDSTINNVLVIIIISNNNNVSGVRPIISNNNNQDNVYVAVLLLSCEKSSDFHDILYTAAYFELQG